MAGSFFALLDDIASIAAKTSSSTFNHLNTAVTQASASSIDDIASMSAKTSAKTSSILIDDTAAMSTVTEGTTAEREIPIILKIAKGSLKNKAIIIPGALIASGIAPWIIPPILLIGGSFLAYEAGEVLLSKYNLLRNHHEKKENNNINKNQEEIEKGKISNSIKTDFVLSLEIILMALSLITTSPFLIQSVILLAVGISTTVGVYGTVGVIIKMDDLGLHFMKKKSILLQKLGKKLVEMMPKVISALSTIGIVAMFMVGGSIISHSLPGFHHLMSSMDKLPSILETGINLTAESAIGLIIGSTLAKLDDISTPVKSFFKNIKNKIFPKKKFIKKEEVSEKKEEEVIKQEEVSEKKKEEVIKQEEISKEKIEKKYLKTTTSFTESILDKTKFLVSKFIFDNKTKELVKVNEAKIQNDIEIYNGLE